MANFRGFAAQTGQRTKHTRNNAKAPRLRPPKTSIRSHRLTVLHSVATATGGMVILTREPGFILLPSSSRRKRSARILIGG